MTAKGMGARKPRKFDDYLLALQMSTSKGAAERSSSRSALAGVEESSVKKSSLSWSPSSSDAARRSFKGVSLTRRSNSDCTSASDDQMKHKISSPGRREFPDRTDGKVCKPARDADGQPIRASSPNRAASPIRAPLRVNITEPASPASPAVEMLRDGGSAAQEEGNAGVESGPCRAAVTGIVTVESRACSNSSSVAAAATSLPAVDNLGESSLLRI